MVLGRIISAETQCSMVGTGDESLRGVAHAVVSVEKVSFFQGGEYVAIVTC